MERRGPAIRPCAFSAIKTTGIWKKDSFCSADWPPSAADLQQAGEVCEELGLGELLQRMPAGLQQQVGETGWQLSHGERSRVFLARALLQQADLTILDESFAALDPQQHALAPCLPA